MMTRNENGTMVPVTLEMFLHCLVLGSDGVERHHQVCVQETMDRLRNADEFTMGVLAIQLVLIVYTALTSVIMLALSMVRYWKGPSHLVGCTLPFLANTILLVVALVAFDLWQNFPRVGICVLMAAVNGTCCFALVFTTGKKGKKEVVMKEEEQMLQLSTAQVEREFMETKY